MKQKLIYGILALAICAYITYLALLVGCDHCLTGGPELSEYALTATHIGNLNSTTEAYIRETQAAITPTTFDPLPTSTPELFNIVWSTQDIPCGTLITEDMVELKPTPIELMPNSPTTTLSLVLGKYTRIEIPADVQVFPNSFSDTPVDC